MRGEDCEKPPRVLGRHHADDGINLLLDVGVTPVGKTRGEGVWLYGCDLLTPKDATTTWYFWSFVRNYKVDDPAVDAMWRAAIEVAFVGQDKPILEQQQRMMGQRTLDDMGPVMASADVAATRARPRWQLPS